MSRHRADVRPRWGRVSTLGVSLTVVLVALLGATGVLPTGGTGSARLDAAAADAGAADPTTPAADPSTGAGDDGGSPADTGEDTGAAATGDGGAAVAPGTASGSRGSSRPVTDASSDLAATALPADSGQGRRVVFSQGLQRVWLVEDGDSVRRTYPVSGSVYDNLSPGTFSVYSRSEDATGIDGSTMHLFVRFTQGPSGAAIGFHTIPELGGDPVQTLAQLGTPLSHGCIRQRTSDAERLWEFAPLGTTVVVVA